MQRNYAIKDPLEENRIFLGRVVASFVFIIILILGLIGRLVYLQITGHEHYSTMSKSNRIKIIPLPRHVGLFMIGKVVF